MKTIQDFREELAAFKETTDAFYAGQVSVKDYKGFSGYFGSYAQRGGQASMLRLRMPGGRMTKEKLKFIADMIHEYSVDTAHFTTCQTVQLHNLSGKAAAEIMEKALDVGIVTIGGGGDFPRNTMASPLSGVEKGEYFDVLPYAEAVSDYLLAHISDQRMPRKLKVGFSNSPDNVCHATFRDLGFVAQSDGRFSVYSAGGLGSNPRMGVKVAENVEPNMVLYYAQAMVEVFCAYGNYENRGKARTRYMQDTLGVDGYRQAFRAKLAEVMKREDLKRNLQPTVIEKTGDGSTASGERVLEQKQEGLYAVAYHPIGGQPKVEKFAQIYDAIRDAEDAEVRIAPDETVYIINLTGTEAERVLAVTDDGAKNRFEVSVSCIGSSICQVGLRDSQGALRRILERVESEHFPDGTLPRFHISGCVSSCGTHQIGVIGFHGCSKRVDGAPASAFTVHLGGCDEQGRECFGQERGVMLEKDMPEFFVALGKTVAASGKPFEVWNEENPGALGEIVEKFCSSERQ